MKRSKLTCDVYLSYKSEDEKTAIEVAEILRMHGLRVFSQHQVRLDSEREQLIWDAMAESQALVMIISASEFTPNMSFELGAAKAWNKSLFGILTDSSLLRGPAELVGMDFIPLERIDDLAIQIKQSLEPLRSDEVEKLLKEYSVLGVPVDHLAMQNAALTDLTKRVEKATRRHLTRESLLRTLIRLRKQGALPRLVRSEKHVGSN